MRAQLDPEFAAFVAARQQRLLHAAYLVCGDRALAQDLLQEALLKLALRWDRLRHEQPDAYVRTILYRDAVSSWRRRRREVLVDVPPDVSRVDPVAEAAERIDIVRALRVLTPKQRAIVVLRFFEDRSVAECADALGISQGTIKSQTYAAVRQLRGVLPDLTHVEVEP